MGVEYVAICCTLYFTDAVSLIHITASYTTPFKCSDGSYALISGTNLTIEYNYGHSRSEVRMTLSTDISPNYIELFMLDRVL